jgi:hypothetical protein
VVLALVVMTDSRLLRQASCEVHASDGAAVVVPAAKAGSVIEVVSEAHFSQRSQIIGELRGGGTQEGGGRGGVSLVIPWVRGKELGAPPSIAIGVLSRWVVSMVLLRHSQTQESTE